MVLLKKLENSPGGPTLGRVEGEEESRVIEGLPSPRAMSVIGKANVEIERKKLIRAARDDQGGYYYFQDLEECFQNPSNARDLYSIGYIVFEK